MIKAWLDDDGYHVTNLSSGDDETFSTINELLAYIVDNIEDGTSEESAVIPIVLFTPNATRDGNIWAWGPGWTPDKLRSCLPVEMGE